MLYKFELVSKSCSAAALSHRAIYHCLSGGVSGGVSGVSGGGVWYAWVLSEGTWVMSGAKSRETSLTGGKYCLAS